MRRPASTFVVLCLIAIACAAEDGFRAATAPRDLPLAFVPNRGQAAAPFVFLARAPGFQAALAPGEAVLAFADGPRGHALALRFDGANPTPSLKAEGKLAARIHEIHGNDPARWQKDLPAYEAIVYEDLWPGIDLRLRGNEGTLKYEFLVRPGARPSAIRLAYAGASALRLGDGGALLIETPFGVLRDAPPSSWQVIDGKRVAVASRYALRDTNGYAFALDGWDPAYALVIDPGLAYSTFLGGNGTEIAYGVAVDSGGNAYVAGYTGGSFPTTTGTFVASVDVFVTKFTAGGSLAYSTTFGGSDAENEPYIAVSASGSAYVTGWTYSHDYPTTPGAYDTIQEWPQSEAFVTRLDANGFIAHSTYLGGPQFEVPAAIGVDGAGNAYIAGSAGPSGYPTTPGAFQTDPLSDIDGFVTKITGDLSSLVYSTLLGGSGNDEPHGMAVLPNGNVVVGGMTGDGFPTTPGAWDPTFNGDFADGYVAVLDAAGASLVYSTYLGGERSDLVNAVAVDHGGNAYAAGDTESAGFPTTPGAADRTLGGTYDGFVAKLDATGSLVYATLVGASAGDAVRDIAVDESGSALIAGETGSIDFPVTADAFDASHGGALDAFVARLDPTGSSYRYATYLGGSSFEYAFAIEAASGGCWVAGYTSSADFPVTPDAALPTHGGEADAFVTRFLFADSDTTPPALTAFDFEPKSIDATAAPAAVTVTLGLADGLSGVMQACLYFSSPSDQIRFGCASPVSGSNFAGTWEATIAFPRFVESGVWRVAAVTLWDFAGNSAVWDTATLAGAGYPTALTVVSLSDVTPPALNALAFDPPSPLDVSAGGVTVEVTLGISDDLSGVDMTGGCNCSWWALTLTSPNGQQRIISNMELTRTAGTDLAGTWTGSFVMPQHSDAGAWTIQEIRLFDDAFNEASFDADGLAAAGLPRGLDVISPLPDLVAPQLLDLDFWPLLINASAGTQPVTVEIGASDALSGVDLSADVTLGPTTPYGLSFRSPSGAQTILAGPRPEWEAAAGTPANGRWRKTVVFPQYAESGTWTVASVILKDAVGNRVTVPADALTAAGLPTDLIVIRPSLEIDGSLSPAGGTVLDAAFEERASITAPPGVLPFSTLVSIDVLTSPLALPTPSGYTGTGTYYVNVSFDPEPPMPLAAPGLTVVLPLVDPMIAGERIDLFRVDPATGTLVPATDAAGNPIAGSVGPDGLTARFTGVARFSTVAGLVPAVRTVAIDIKPGEAIAAINSTSRGNTPVAILSDPAFDAVAAVDRATLTFGRTGDEESLAFCNPRGEDVNRDGAADLVCHFETIAAGFVAGDSVGTLRGMTTGGTAIEGRDAIRVVK